MAWELEASKNMTISVGERVQARISELQTNSTEVARRAGLERTFVHDLISGRKKTVTAEALIALAKALGCLPEDLVGKAGEIRRNEVGGIEIVGVIEQEVWRGSPPRNLGTITSFNEGNTNAKAFIVRGDDAAPVGIMDGSAVIADTSGRVRSGDIAVVERERGGLKELSLRRVGNGDGPLILLSLDGDPGKTLQAGDAVKVIGRVQRAILLFSSAIL
jgi:DNA-binding Xre family transcriptional regulator